VSASAATPPRPALAGIDVGGAPDAWAAAGFSLDGGEVVAGGVQVRALPGSPGTLRLVSPRDGSGPEPRELDGLAVEWAPAPSEARRAGSAAHPNGAVAVDLAVVVTGSRERTGAALAAVGLPFGRRLEGEVPGGGLARRGFLRFANGPILEVVEPHGAPPGPARLWGIQFAVDDLDRAAADLGPLLGEPHDAVQPGRRIATVRREAGLGVAVSLITPEPARGGA